MKVEEVTASVEQASVATEQITKEMEEISNSAEVQNNEVESGAELIGEIILRNDSAIVLKLPPN